ncbi:MAG: hypothetical protein ACYCWW_12435, partial [Deltaproteobacteria bacterium]
MRHLLITVGLSLTACAIGSAPIDWSTKGCAAMADCPTGWQCTDGHCSQNGSATTGLASNGTGTSGAQSSGGGTTGSSGGVTGASTGGATGGATSSGGSATSGGTTGCANASGCTAEGEQVCAPDGTSLDSCVRAPSGCLGTQLVTACADAGFVCDARGGAPGCHCPGNSTPTFYVDPTNGSDLDAGTFPSGVNLPAACRFRTLTHALAVAGAAGAEAQVVATGATPVVFVGPSGGGERFPLVV